MRYANLKPPQEQSEFVHFGIKGMHWGRRKSPELAAPAAKTLRDQAAQGLRHDAGKVAALAVIKQYGHLAVPAAKGAIKGTATILRYSGRAARGAKTTVKILFVVGKYAFKFGKAYGRGAVKLAKLGR